MKFNFKIQQYQTEAVENTVEVFSGQPSVDSLTYRRDMGQMLEQSGHLWDDVETGYRNNEVQLTSAQLLENIRKIQVRCDITQSQTLVSGLGACNLDIEMETGTGKTYVYIKTMFEMNKRYGWSKFIVVVPSIAIREGVGKSFRMLEDHFMEHYGKKARWFIYDSSRLKSLDDFSSDAGINVMIINTQAFAASLKEGAKNKESRIIYSKRDDFASRRPIDVIAANRPIIIMDEPQKMEGDATKTALKRFNPLFVLNYSATHKTKHNTIYALDALDAYNKKLVKKIQVKGFEVKNLRGSSSYLYLDSIILSKNNPPMAKIEFEYNGNTGIRKMSKILGKGDKLYVASNGLGEYEGFDISDIDPYTNSVHFLNGLVLKKGEVYGDNNELAMQRVQIRETIVSHFEKERELYSRGIKTLSLFFIDEVSKYKSYGEDGEIVKGELWKIFEEEYNAVLSERMSLFDSDYQRYLRRFEASEVHNGYFSIDKKGHSVNSEIKRGRDISDDISAYDLILKNKERLLSFEEPTRFIFSHSALREGWDNPNVFQICTLRHANSATAKRQEVGRGLRLCVDSNGNRMDYETLGDNVHDLNRLTVIANESYSDFVGDLQRETRDILRERPTKADVDYFTGKIVIIGGEKHSITKDEATAIRSYLWENEYIDDNGLVTALYKSDLATDNLVPLSRKLQPMTDGIHRLVQSIFDEKIREEILDEMFEDGNATTISENKLNENFSKKEFQELWKSINHKYAYTVHYDSRELIEKSILNINANLDVAEMRYVVVTGEQQTVDGFCSTSSTSKKMGTISTTNVKYDLVGEIARGATITRRSVVSILKGLNPKKRLMFQNNPEEFIRNVIRLIREQKATMIVEHIAYNQIEGQYDSTIFTQEKQSKSVNKSYQSKKHILDYVLSDSDIERDFARDMDISDEVCVYAKLPRSFQIPTPVGNYAPDWAIAFNKGNVKHVFFIAETKGSLDSMELRGVEKAKIDCARKLFNNISDINIRYDAVDNFDALMNILAN